MEDEEVTVVTAVRAAAAAVAEPQKQKQEEEQKQEPKEPVDQDQDQDQDAQDPHDHDHNHNDSYHCHHLNPDWLDRLSAYLMQLPPPAPPPATTTTTTTTTTEATSAAAAHSLRATITATTSTDTLYGGITLTAAAVQSLTDALSSLAAKSSSSSLSSSSLSLSLRSSVFPTTTLTSEHNPHPHHHNNSNNNKHYPHQSQNHTTTTTDDDDNDHQTHPYHNSNSNNNNNNHYYKRSQRQRTQTRTTLERLQHELLPRLCHLRLVDREREREPEDNGDHHHHHDHPLDHQEPSSVPPPPRRQRIILDLQYFPNVQVLILDHLHVQEMMSLDHHHHHDAYENENEEEIQEVSESNDHDTIIQEEEEDDPKEDHDLISSRSSSSSSNAIRVTRGGGDDPKIVVVLRNVTRLKRLHTMRMDHCTLCTMRNDDIHSNHNNIHRVSNHRNRNSRRRSSSHHHHPLLSLQRLHLSHCAIDDSPSRPPPPPPPHGMHHHHTPLLSFWHSPWLAGLQSITFTHLNVSDSDRLEPVVVFFLQALLCDKPRLTHVNLSHITHFPSSSSSSSFLLVWHTLLHTRVLGNLHTLNVAHNALTTLYGIPYLRSLQVLHAQHNQLLDWSEIRALALHLPLLHTLTLHDNPLCHCRTGSSTRTHTTNNNNNNNNNTTISSLTTARISSSSSSSSFLRKLTLGPSSKMMNPHPHPHHHYDRSTTTSTTATTSSWEEDDHDHHYQNYRLAVLELFLQHRWSDMNMEIIMSTTLNTTTTAVAAASSSSSMITVRQVQLHLPALDGQAATVSELRALRPYVYPKLFVSVVSPLTKTMTKTTLSPTTPRRRIMQQQQQQQQQRRRRGRRRRRELGPRSAPMAPTAAAAANQGAYHNLLHNRHPPHRRLGRPLVTFSVLDVMASLHHHSPDDDETNLSPYNNEGILLLRHPSSEEIHNNRNHNNNNDNNNNNNNNNNNALIKDANSRTFDLKENATQQAQESMSRLPPTDDLSVDSTLFTTDIEALVETAKYDDPRKASDKDNPADDDRTHVTDDADEKKLAMSDDDLFASPLSPIRLHQHSEYVLSSSATTGTSIRSAAATLTTTTNEASSARTDDDGDRKSFEASRCVVDHSPNSQHKLPSDSIHSPPRSVRQSSESSNASSSIPSPIQQLTIQNAFQFTLSRPDDSFSVATSTAGISISTALPHFDETAALQKYTLAEKNSTFDRTAYFRMIVLENLELYFRLFVFHYNPTTLPIVEVASFASGVHSTMSGQDDHNQWRSVLEQFPKIQLWPVDHRMREAFAEKARLRMGNVERIGHHPHEYFKEEFRRVWKEQVVACGKPALRRLTPCRAPRLGFHGELIMSNVVESSQFKPESVAKSREVILCLSNRSLYVIVPDDSITSLILKKDPSRKFPRPLLESTSFEEAKWPHALAWHPIHTLTGITIGFGFQRLILRFSNSTFPSPDDFTYVLLTSNKLETVSLLKEIQDLVSEVSNDQIPTSVLTSHSRPRRIDTIIENDDRCVLDALGVAVAPDVIDVVLHFQIVSQYWQHGDRGAVRRVCLVSGTKIYLLDEDYAGDGSESLEAGHHRTLGESSYRVVDSAMLPRISIVKAADADPCSITLSIRPTSRLSRTHNWRLYCRDRNGAEQLVDDVRKALVVVE